MKITNKGPDAYKPDVYGEHIIIERRISKDGASGYKIKSSSTGKTISTKREELAAICDHMSIQVDNPLTILSQDSARQFLNSSTPEDKYKVSVDTHSRLTILDAQLLIIAVLYERITTYTAFH